MQFGAIKSYQLAKIDGILDNCSRFYKNSNNIDNIKGVKETTS